MECSHEGNQETTMADPTRGGGGAPENLDCELVGFAYAEDVHGDPPRSLGYRLLTPTDDPNLEAEIDTLARWLQATPYPDHWPEANLFCSILLSDGRRLIALARYGVTDHTPGHRRGGLELIGVITPAQLSGTDALAIYRWLRQWRVETEDPRHLGTRVLLPEVLASAPPPAMAQIPTARLPIRVWHDGVLLFSANTPGDPDQHLEMLLDEAGPTWQWLPLVGTDCPVESYAERGPVIGWTPHNTLLAVRMDRRTNDQPPAHTTTAGQPQHSRFPAILAGSLITILLGLLIANLWSILLLHKRVKETAQTPPTNPPAEQPKQVPTQPPGSPETGNPSRERFVAALNQLLQEHGGKGERKVEQAALLQRYKRLAMRYDDLKLPEDDIEGRMTVAVISVLAERNADHIAEVIRKALSEKRGFSPKVAEAASAEVHDHLVREVQGSR